LQQAFATQDAGISREIVDVHKRSFEQASCLRNRSCSKRRLKRRLNKPLARLLLHWGAVGGEIIHQFMAASPC
jgi:hypothetical protein